MGLVGKVVHYSFDAILISTIVAGIRRSTGLTLRPNAVDSPDMQSYVRRYLEVGEWVLDSSSNIMAASGYFERRLP